MRKVLRRPWSPPTPAWLVPIGAFLMGTAPVLALTGRRVLPKRLLDEGFEFQFTELDAALAEIFARKTAAAPRDQGEQPWKPTCTPSGRTESTC